MHGKKMSLSQMLASCRRLCYATEAAGRMERGARWGLKLGASCPSSYSEIGQNGEGSPMGIEAPSRWGRHHRFGRQDGEGSPMGIEAVRSPSKRLCPSVAEWRGEPDGD